MNKYLKISKEVQEALDNHKPIVALESTIISHGMPYPQNYETALKCQQIVRDNGAIPATIAIIKGQLCVGLEDNEIEYLAKEGPKVTKVSRRDIPVIAARKLDGATTVAATMYIASLANIKVFATGGIGGVHRGAEISMDISADLEELANTDVAVVCAGVKAILDIEKTLEYLETKGVIVLGYGVDYMPDFYTRKSSSKVPYKVNDANDCANILNAKWSIGLKGGALIANPIPEEYSLDEKIMNDAIDKALLSMNDLGIKGKEQTPYLLKTIVDLTSGLSLEANINLVFNNCKVASEIAVEYNKLCD